MAYENQRALKTGFLQMVASVLKVSSQEARQALSYSRNAYS
jgi:hypothetical protein